MVSENIKENTKNTVDLNDAEEADLSNGGINKEEAYNEKATVENEEATESETTQCGTTTKENDNMEEEVIIEGIDDVIKQLDEEKAKNKEYLELLQRKAAEFDNYRKRTTKEKESIYANAICDTISKLIPVVDNLERAIQASEKVESNDKALKDGVNLVYKQLLNALDDLNVKPIETIDQEFNPEYHNAVMHIEDESYGENAIVEEFQKGYIYKDELVIRHSMVKVAN